MLIDMSLLLLPIMLVFAVLVFLFLIFPSCRKHADLELLRGKFVAHRGFHNKEVGVPENSLTSFDAAVRNGYPIEIDIHLTRDGEVVVFHDDTLKRMCGKEGVIEKMTLKELKTMKLSDTDEEIPTLSECLCAVSGRVPLLIEFKCKHNAVSLCLAADKILSEYNGKYLVQSFYPTALYWYKRNRKDVCRGQLSESFKHQGFVKRMLGFLLFNFLSRPDFISYKFSDAGSFCRKLCVKLGAMPVGWTFKTQIDADRFEKDFDTYIFEEFNPSKDNADK